MGPLIRVVNFIVFDVSLLVYSFVHGQSTTAPPEKFCSVPASFVDKTVTYKCYGETAKSCNKSGDQLIAQFTVANFECNPGYINDQGNKFKSVCLESEFIPPINKCHKLCDKINPVNIDLACYNKNSSVDCEANLFPGTKIRPVCKSLHTNKDFTNVYREITCQEDGKWDHPLFSCVPECGRPYNNSLNKFRYKRLSPARYSDSPWYVGIYDVKTEFDWEIIPTKNRLVCGGTIISPRLILSAASCFYNETTGQKKDPGIFEVVVSKATPAYSDVDNAEQRIYKIKEIRFSNRGFLGSSNNYASDIAVLILSERISSSQTVLPACVDWIHTDIFHPRDETSGKVVGWYGERYPLRTDSAFFVERTRCFKSTPRDFYPLITSDKFCAQIEDVHVIANGPSQPVSNIGTGLVFRDGASYYIRGVLTSAPNHSSVSLFVDVATHIDWILSVHNEVEENVVERQINVRLKSKN